MYIIDIGVSSAKHNYFKHFKNTLFSKVYETQYFILSYK